MARDANIGDNVNVVSGPHEGRSGVIKFMKQQSAGMYSDPEWYALLEIDTLGPDDKMMKDEIAVPLRRLRPR